jgi:hypothetical protein
MSSQARNSTNGSVQLPRRVMRRILRQEPRYVLTGLAAARSGDDRFAIDSRGLDRAGRRPTVSNRMSHSARRRFSASLEWESWPPSVGLNGPPAAGGSPLVELRSPRRRRSAYHPTRMIGFAAPVASKWDRAGILVSGACAIHCAVLPLLAGLLPVVGLPHFTDERTEWWVVALTAAVRVIGHASAGSSPSEATEGAPDAHGNGGRMVELQA